METHAHSERGGDHPDNEDFILRICHSSGHGRKLYFLADGQGGRTDGAIASRAACEGAISFAGDCSWEELMSPSVWDDIFAAADQSVRASCEGFTTMIGIACSPHQIFGASIGDSKAYYFQNEGDQDFELTDRQKKNPPIGAGIKQAACFSVTDFKGTILAVSDGVWKYAGYKELLKASGTENTIENIPELLRTSILGKQESELLPDDFSVVAIRS